MNNITTQSILDYAEKLINKGISVVPTRTKPNSDGKCKVPIWEGEASKSKVFYSDFENFKKTVESKERKNITVCGFGVFLGLLNNKKQMLIALDNDAINNHEIKDFLISYFSKKQQKQIEKIEDISGFERTLSENGYHIYILLNLENVDIEGKTDREILNSLGFETSYAFSNTNWQSKDTNKTKDGKEKYGSVEIFLTNRIMACYPQVNERFALDDVDNLPVFEIEELREFISELRRFDNIHKNTTANSIAVLSEIYNTKDTNTDDNDDYDNVEVIFETNKDLDLLNKIVEASKDMYREGILNGAEIDLGLSATLMKLGYNDKEIVSVFKMFWGSEYEERRTLNLIEATKRKIKEEWDGKIRILRKYRLALEEKLDIQLFKSKEYTDPLFDFINEYERSGFKLELISFIPTEYDTFARQKPTIFLTKDNKLYYLQYRFSKNDGIVGELQDVCSYFTITKKIVNEDDEVIAYEFKTPTKTFEMSADIVDDKRNSRFFKELSRNLGRIYTDKDRQKWINAYVTLLSEKEDLPVEKVITKIGWRKDEDGNLRYYHPNAKPDMNFLTNEFTKAGKKEEELKALRYVFEKQSALSLGYIFGFASILIKPLELPNYTVLLSGRRGSGKTATGKLGLSIFGNPEKLFKNFNNTVNYIEKFLASRNDTFTLIDEIYSIRGKKENKIQAILDLIYSISTDNAETRGRLTNYGESLGKTHKLSGIYCMTSEVSLQDYLANIENPVEGIFRRMLGIDLYRRKIDRADIEYVFSIISKNHGNLLKNYVDYVEENLDKIRKVYSQEKLRLLEKEKEKEGLERFEALLYTTLNIISQVFSINLQKARDFLSDILEENRKEQLRGLNVITRESLINAVLEFTAEYNGYFARFDERLLKLYGKIDTNSETKKMTVYITHQAFTKLAEFCKIDRATLEREMTNFGLAKRSSFINGSIKYNAFKIEFETDEAGNVESTNTQDNTEDNTYEDDEPVDF